MRRVCIITCVLLVAFALAVEFSVSSAAEGRYDLTVHVDSSEAPSAVGCWATSEQGKAETVCAMSLQRPLVSEEAGSAFANPYKGQPLKVHDWTTHVYSPFGRTLSYSQSGRFLVVSAEWADGRKTCKVVEIPDGRLSREVRVTLP